MMKSQQIKTSKLKIVWYHITTIFCYGGLALMLYLFLYGDEIIDKIAK